MYGNLEELIKKIVESTDLDENKVKKLIKEKELEFSGLISKEGAAHIVAKEYGLNLLKETSKELKIENIVSGMRSVNVKGKIERIFEPREFEKNGKKGKVASIIIADETGEIRVSLWDEQVKVIDNLNEGETIEILNGYTKGNKVGGCELRIGRGGKIKKIEEEILTTRKTARTYIKNLVLGSYGEVRGAVVQFFETKPFFFVCPVCGKKIIDNKCDEHGEVKPKPELILSGILDDGTGNIRTVFFREQAEKILGLSAEDLYKKTDEGKDLSILKEKIDEILGKEFIIGGRVKKNQFFERLELMVNKVESINPEKEAETILNSLEKKE